MSRFFYAREIGKPRDVIPYLGKRERDWKKGYSAYELAHSWVHAGDIPTTVRCVLDTCPEYAGAQLVEGLFERDVDLRTPGRRSQTEHPPFRQGERVRLLVVDQHDAVPGEAQLAQALARCEVS